MIEGKRTTLSLASFYFFPNKKESGGTLTNDREHGFWASAAAYRALIPYFQNPTCQKSSMANLRSELS
jgi:hypothetical protein